MSTATVQRVGDLLMLTLPADLRDELHLHEGSELVLRRDQDELLVKKRQPSLQELLARCDFSLPPSEEDQTWNGMKPIGRELL